MHPSLIQFRNKKSDLKKQTLDPYDYLSKILDSLLERKEIKSFCLFVRDPISGELRLEKMKGIQHPEPLDGLILSLEEEHCLQANLRTTFQEKQYFAEPRLAKLVAQDDDCITLKIREKIQNLIESNNENQSFCVYRDFVDREGIVACVRHEHRVNESINAVLFINFNCQIDLEKDTDLKSILDEIYEDVSEYLTVLPKLPQEHSKALQQLIKILHPIHELSADSEQHDPKFFFKKILDSTLTAMGVDNTEGFGTIHLFHPDTPDGDLVLCANTIQSDNIASTLKAYQGEGVVSWVALHRKPLLINDLQNSIFNRLHKKHFDGFCDIQSELAVPMLVGGELLGVLNLEHRKKDAFTRQDVHTLWYASTEAGLAYKFCNNLQRAINSEKRISELLEIGYSTANTGARDVTVLNKLASLLQQWLAPDFAEIWLYDEVANTFSHRGASYEEFENDVSPRFDGLSKWVLQSKIPVWVAKIAPDGSYDRAFWDKDAGQWEIEPNCSASALPTTVNPIVLKQKISSEICVPVNAHKHCIGVIWLKYSRSDAAKLEMSLITQLAGQIAIVIDSMFQAERREEQEIGSELVKEYFDVGKQDKHGMEGYVLYEPYHGQLGGDFCVSLSETERSWAYLLGDVQGHGYRAAVRMLPLITAFKIFYRESKSPNYVLNQLASVNRQVDKDEDFATALCFAYFEQEQKNKTIRRFIKASSAGHPSLMVVRNKSNGIDVKAIPEADGPATTQCLGTGPLADFSEECIEVFSGDLLIAYTDGLVEAPKIKADRTHYFGIPEAASYVLPHAKESAECIAKGLFKAAKAFAKDALNDDVTIIVVKII